MVGVIETVLALGTLLFGVVAGVVVFYAGRSAAYPEATGERTAPVTRRLHRPEPFGVGRAA